MFEVLFYLSLACVLFLVGFGIYFFDEIVSAVSNRRKDHFDALDENGNKCGAVIDKWKVIDDLSTLHVTGDGAGAREQSLRILAQDILSNEYKLDLIRSYVDRARIELESQNYPYMGGHWVVFCSVRPDHITHCSLDEINIDHLWKTSDVAVYGNVVLIFSGAPGWEDMRTGTKYFD